MSLSSRVMISPPSGIPSQSSEPSGARAAVSPSDLRFHIALPVMTSVADRTPCAVLAEEQVADHGERVVAGAPAGHDLAGRQPPHLIAPALAAGPEDHRARRPQRAVGAKRLGNRRRAQPAAADRRRAPAHLPVRDRPHLGRAAQALLAALDATSSGFATAGIRDTPAGGVSHRCLPVARSSARSVPARSETRSVRPTRRISTSPRKPSGSPRPQRRAPVSRSRPVIRRPASCDVTASPASANTTRSPLGPSTRCPRHCGGRSRRRGRRTAAPRRRSRRARTAARRVAIPAATRQATPSRNGSRPKPAIGRRRPKSRPAASKPIGEQAQDRIQSCAELLLDDLAHRVAGQLVEEADLARALVGRELAGHVVDQVLLRRALAVGHHPGDDLLAEVGVLLAGDRGLEHAGCSSSATSISPAPTL